MKKIITLFLCALLLCVSVTGCSKKTLLSPKDPVTLTLWHVYGEQADSPMNRMVEEFNLTVGQEKGVLVSVTNVTSTSKIGPQLQDILAGKPGTAELPDLFSCHSTATAYLGADKLVDWNQYFSQEERSNYVSEFLEDGTVDGRLVSFPVSKSTYALFVNGSQFDRFSADTGVTYEMLSTWEGFFDAAEKYHEWSGGKAFAALDYLIRHVELDMLASKGDFEYTEDGWYDLSDPALKASWLKFAKPLVQGHIVVSDAYSNTQVMTGEVLSGIGSTAAIIYYNDTVTYPDNTSEPTNLRVLPLPKSGDGKEFMPQTGVGLAAFKTTDQKAEAASVFLHWFTEGTRNLDFVAETGYMPVNNEAFDAIDSYEFADAGYESLYDSIRTMRNTCTPVVRPDFGNFYDRTNLLYDTLREQQGLLAERADAGEDVDALAAEVWDIFCSIE